MATDIELPKAQISKIIQSGAFLEALLSKIAGPLCSSSIDEKHFSSIMINSWCYRNWCSNSKKSTWIWDNNFNNFKWKNEWHNKNSLISWEDFNILLKEVTKTIENETKEQKGGFLSMLLGTLGGSD